MVQWRSSESQNSSLKNSTLASLLLHTDTLDHSFSCCMVEIHVKIPLRFLTIFKQSHFNFLTLSLASSRSHSLTGINYLVEIKIWRPHMFHNFFPFYCFFKCFGCHIVPSKIRFLYLLILPPVCSPIFGQFNVFKPWEQNCVKLFLKRK